ncbi:MAG: rhodanese-like domain-containing protein [Candidatus Sifarchaeia archaeon]|jgi:rhodanese-related sulfurtransferase
MVHIINTEELKEKMDKREEEFILLDVRDTPDYEEEHIIGAIHLLISEMNEKKVDSMFTKNDLIITYSEDINCPAKRIAAEKLISYGFRNVIAYDESWKAWKEANYPTESS